MATTSAEPARISDQVVQVDQSIEAGYTDTDSSYGSDQYVKIIQVSQGRRIHVAPWDLTHTFVFTFAASTDPPDYRDSYTTSLADSITNYQFENGRRYHAYKQGSYVFPNDERESERLDILHQMFKVLQDGKIHYAPLKDPKRALDVATGTGIWAIEFADNFPNCDVAGNDLSPIQPKWVPPNVHFEVDDIEEEWVYSKPFDFIHIRHMSTAVRDWPKLIRQAYKHCKPGGYVEFADFDASWTSPDGSLTKDTAIYYICHTFVDVARASGIEACPGPLIEGWMKDAGFVDITVKRHVIPAGVWPADKRLKEVGAWWYLNMMENIDGLLMATFTRFHGMTAEEVHVLASKFRADLKNPKIHSMLEWYVTYGRKPEDAEEDPAGEKAEEA